MIFAQDTSLNALTNVDVNRIWLPFIVYANTDQKVLLIFTIVSRHHHHHHSWFFSLSMQTLTKRCC